MGYTFFEQVVLRHGHHSEAPDPSVRSSLLIVCLTILLILRSNGVSAFSSGSVKKGK